LEHRLLHHLASLRLPVSGSLHCRQMDVTF